MKYWQFFALLSLVAFAPHMTLWGSIIIGTIYLITMLIALAKGE